MAASNWESAKEETIRIYGLVEDSIVDGPGLRFGIFVQGCSHDCPGCHNPESQPFGCGQIYTLDQIRSKVLENKLISGVTFSGGEPFDQSDKCAPLAKKLKQDGHEIWAYSGYLVEDLLEKAKTNSSIESFLNSIDVLVDGPYIDDFQSYELKWRGSSNQRLIDMPKTLQAGTVELWEPPAFDFTTPPSW